MLVLTQLWVSNVTFFIGSGSCSAGGLIGFGDWGLVSVAKAEGLGSCYIVSLAVIGLLALDCDIVFLVPGSPIFPATAPLSLSLKSFSR